MIRPATALAALLLGSLLLAGVLTLAYYHTADPLCELEPIL
jgi:hypothetical protein